MLVFKFAGVKILFLGICLGQFKILGTVAGGVLICQHAYLGVVWEISAIVFYLHLSRAIRR